MTCQLPPPKQQLRRQVWTIVSLIGQSKECRRFLRVDDQFLKTNLPIPAEVVVRSGKYFQVLEYLRGFVPIRGRPVHEQEEQTRVDELRPQDPSRQSG